MYQIIALLLLNSFGQTPTKNKVTILHTNDIHGWIDAHRHIEKLDADIGDYVSFINHTKNKSGDDEIVLVFDSGDLVEGTGLSDDTLPVGSFIFDIFKDVPIDGTTIGNHEAYNEDCIDNIANIYSVFGGKMISGNVAHSVSTKKLADKFAFKVIPGFGKILVFGFLFDFNESAKAPNAEVTFAADVVQETWFTNALTVHGDARLIVILGHFPIAADETEANENIVDVYVNAIRTAQPTTPVVVLGGHQHQKKEKRDADKLVVRIQSLCYFQLVGVIHFSLSPVAEAERSLRLSNADVFINLNITHLDTSLSSFYAETGTNASTFPTDAGTAIKQRIAQKKDELGLSTVYGCSPQAYSERVTEEPPSVYDLVLDNMFPTMEPMKDTGYTGPPKGTVYIGNIRWLRSKLYAGEIFLEDVKSLDPFNDKFVAIRDVSKSDVRIALYKLPAVSLAEARARMKQRRLSNSNSSSEREVKNMVATEVEKKVPADTLVRVSEAFAEQMVMNRKAHVHLTRAQKESIVERVAAGAGVLLAPSSSSSSSSSSSPAASASAAEGERSGGDKSSLGTVSVSVSELTDYLLGPPSHLYELGGVAGPDNRYFMSSTVSWDDYATFDVITNDYDYEALLKALKDVSGQVYSYEISDYGEQETFKEYFKKYMKCPGPPEDSAANIFVTGTFLRSISVLFALLLFIVI